MKKGLHLTVLFLLLLSAAYAQNVPKGMNYQAVARNLSGSVLANQEISLKISLLTTGNAPAVYYTEVHNVTTNQLGLFTLVIGEGKSEKGTFTAVPWSTEDIWMQVSIKDKGNSSFAVISNSKLLAVPYAFHAGTASQLVGRPETGSALVSTNATSSSTSGVPSSPWSTKGNTATDPSTDRLGTGDAADLIIITTNVERIRVLANGDVDVKNKLAVGNDLTAKQNTYLNTVGGVTNIKGATTLQNTLMVGGATALNNKVDITGVTKSTNNTQSTLPTNGALVVTGGAGIGGNLNVGGTVNFDGPAAFGGQLHITDPTQSTSTVTGALIVDGGAGIAKNVIVGGTAEVTGATHLKNTVTADGVTNITNTTQAATSNDGALVVAGGVGIGGNLIVRSTTTLGNTLGIIGVTTSENTTQSTTAANGALVVAGGAGIGGNLNVGGTTNIGGNLNVTGTTSFSSSMGAKGINIVNDTSAYLATFQNTNDGNGDGIKIKLGRAKSVYTIPGSTAPSSDEISAGEAFKDLLRCDYSGDKLTLLGNIIVADATETAKVIAGIAISAGNKIIDAINSGAGLPRSIPDITVPATHVSDAIDISGPINSGLGLPVKMPSTQVFPGWSLTMPPGIPDISIGAVTIGGFQIVPALPAFSIPALDIPQTTILTSRTVMPAIPRITGIPGVDPIDITDLSFWGLDFSLCLSDAAGSSPLNNNNEFIRFADKNDAQVGSIRGVSLTNWASNYLNPVFLSKLRGAFLSSKMDKFHAQYHFKNEVTTALASYAKIGVEYSSGNGDYAEWLERSDKMEDIAAGDIVSVKGGKITKDLKGAEQVMVVSHAPIMLGNMPSEGKTELGNSIVFIGQAPVKVVGPVTSGDFIIGKASTPGYGSAKHPNDMTVEDFKLAVGRSWDTDETEGIKMANTVIGVHNGSFINLIKELKDKADSNDARLKAIEEKLNIGASAKKQPAVKKKK